MKIKCIRCFVFLSCLLSLCGCNKIFQNEVKNENEYVIDLDITENGLEDEKVDTDLSKGDLYMMFEELNNEEVQEFFYDDYNKDGRHEAFVVTKEQNIYKLWYISPSDCQLVSQDLQYVDDQKSEVLEYETKNYLLLHHYKDQYVNTLVYSVNNENEVIEARISDKGYVRHNTKGEVFLDIYDDINDKNKEKKHSFNTYYMYYVYEEGFREYGAIPISEEQFLCFEGAQQILDDVYKKYENTQLDITYLYRANQYINMNITIYLDNRIEYRNVLLKYDDTSVFYVNDEYGKGRIEVAYLLNVATFPTTFKQPQAVER
ncbi:MAG: hypothetical protein E7264_10505 [Lachnospiraceae bacterium]|nr:hypothetical protein [Lachnospiraceae bacterium]